MKTLNRHRGHAGGWIIDDRWRKLIDFPNVPAGNKLYSAAYFEAEACEEVRRRRREREAYTRRRNQVHEPPFAFGVQRFWINREKEHRGHGARRLWILHGLIKFRS